MATPIRTWKPIKKMWSITRPSKPTDDPLYNQVMEVVEPLLKNKSTWDIADETGLSITTIAKHRKHEVISPKSVSLQMWLKTFGYELRIVKIREDDGE